MGNFKVDGIMKIPNNLEADNVNVNGILKVIGDLKTNNLDGDGIVKVEGDVIATTIDMDGLIKVVNSIKTEKLVMDGLIKTRLIEGEEIIIDGKIDVQKSINCETLQIKFGEKCSIDTIECASVKITHKKRKKRYLTADSISADDISIEHVICNAVYGDKISIGPNCTIKKVEYKTSLEVHSSSKVSHIQKIEV